MMKKIISLTFGLLMTMAAWGQSSAAVDLSLIHISEPTRP